MFYQILINELVLYNKKQIKRIKSLRIWVDYTSLVPNVMIRDELIINCEVDVVDRVIPVLQDFLSLDDNLLRLLVDQNSKFHADSNFR
jgi:hypothetical protein